MDRYVSITFSNAVDWPISKISGSYLECVNNVNDPGKKLMWNSSIQSIYVPTFLKSVQPIDVCPRYLSAGTNYSPITPD